MKALSLYIQECCSKKSAKVELRKKLTRKNLVKESTKGVSIDLTYPWYEEGEDASYEEFTEGKYKVSGDTNKILRGIEALADKMTSGDGAAYVVLLNIDDFSIVAYLPEGDLFTSKKHTLASEVSKLLQDNLSVIADEAISWMIDMGVADEDDADNIKGSMEKLQF